MTTDVMTDRGVSTVTVDVPTEALRLVVDAAARELYRPQFASVRFDGNRVMATDAYRLHVVEGNWRPLPACGYTHPLSEVPRLAHYT